MFVEIQIREVYGASKFYPANDTAKIFAEIAGTKTLTKNTLDKIKRLGIDIHEVYVPKYKNDAVVTPGHGGKTW